MGTNKLQWKRIAMGDKLPCQSFLRKNDGEILKLSAIGGVKVGQDYYYLPVDEVINVIKDYPVEESKDERIINNIRKVIGWQRGMFTEKSLMPEQYQEIDTWLEKQGEQKPADEPKFKAGDWIVRELDNTCYQIKRCILNVTTNKYGYDLTNGGYIDSQDANFYHLWTIQDAEDGDMIYVSTEEKGIQAIFHKYEGGIIYFHCSLCRDFVEDGYMPIGDVEFVCPIQNVHYQRFFENMKEAGYEWDAEKLELKKIEQKSTPMSLDEAIEHCKEKSCGNNACALEHKQLEKWLTELKELKEQKPAWSEEDENIIRLSIENLTELEDRYGKEYGQVGDCIDWLESLRPQNRWKPSNEQMEALEHFIVYNNGSTNYAKDLEELRLQLKKLREE